MNDAASAFQDDEFRSGFLNFALGMRETLDPGIKTVILIEDTSFQDLTPEIWAKIHAGLDSIKMAQDVMNQINSMVPVLLDNAKAQEAVGEMVQDRLDKENE